MKIVDALVHSMLALVLAATCLAVLAAGCASKKAAYQVPPGETGVTVEASSFEFKPNLIHARTGEALLLKVTNVAGRTHNLTVLDPQGESLANVDLPAGQTTEIRLPPLAAGAYPFFCGKPFHPSLGMKGEIRVDAP
ncbi:MAG TPA: cupredoxin domain-containing protein [Desulfuromonadales bacterium]|jgi:plastocyanin